MTLFDAALDEVLADTGGRVRASDPETSRVAANTVKAGSQKAQVLLALDVAGDRGLTGHDAWERTATAYPHVATTRLEDLERDGLATRTDRTRPTATGCDALVWTITDAGQRMARELRARSAK